MLVIVAWLGRGRALRRGTLPSRTIRRDRAPSPRSGTPRASCVATIQLEGGACDAQHEPWSVRDAPRLRGRALPRSSRVSQHRRARHVEDMLQLRPLGCYARWCQALRLSELWCADRSRRQRLAWKSFCRLWHCRWHRVGRYRMRRSSLGSLGATLASRDRLVSKCTVGSSFVLLWTVDKSGDRPSG